MDYKNDSKFYKIADNFDGFFLIVGFPKSATSTIATWIDAHPDAYLSEKKEPAFFPSDEYHKGMDFYWEKYFYNYNKQRVVGEAQVVNSYFPYIPERIYNKLPNAKIIFCLRNPIERAFSQWWMDKMANQDLSFKEAINLELKENEYGLLPLDDPNFWNYFSKRWLTGNLKIRSNLPRLYLNIGYYAYHIKRYLNFFDINNMFFIFQEEMQINKADILRDLYTFLKLDPNIIKWDNLKNENVAKNSLWIRRFTNNLKKHVDIEHYPFFITSLVKKGLDFTNQLQRKPKIDDAIRKKLTHFYLDKNRELEELLNRDLSFWNK